MKSVVCVGCTASLRWEQLVMITVIIKKAMLTCIWKQEANSCPDITSDVLLTLPSTDSLSLHFLLYAFSLNTIKRRLQGELTGTTDAVYSPHPLRFPPRQTLEEVFSSYYLADADAANKGECRSWLAVQWLHSSSEVARLVFCILDSGAPGIIHRLEGNKDRKRHGVKSKDRRTDAGGREREREREYQCEAGGGGQKGSTAVKLPRPGWPSSPLSSLLPSSPHRFGGAAAA